MKHLACIHCGSKDLERFRSPRMVGRILFRRHRCRECKQITLSAHGTVTTADAEVLLVGFED